jgi:hypothetical protein
MTEIKIGSLVIDLASGLEGTVTSRVEMFNGNVQYGVQPKVAKDASTMPDPYSIDGSQLKVKGKGISDKATPAQSTDIQIGDEVEDIISGHTGIAATKTTFLNGCVYFDVVKKANDAKKIESTAMFMTCTRLKKVKAAKVKPITPASERPTGGPTTRAYRAI